MLFEFLQTA